MEFKSVRIRGKSASWPRRAEKGAIRLLHGEPPLVQEEWTDGGRIFTRGGKEEIAPARRNYLAPCIGKKGTGL